MGLLINFEGIDGSGTETWSKFTLSFLKNAGYDAVLYRYPDYDSPWGRIITEFLNKKLDLTPEIQFLTFATDIAKDIPQIKKKLAESCFVVTDRYILSTIAYQWARGFPLEKAEKFISLFDYPKPDITILLIIPPDESLRRKIREHGKLDRHEEDILFLKEVNNKYLKLQSSNVFSSRWAVVDTSHPIEIVKEKIKDIIKSLLSQLTPSKNKNLRGSENVTF
ncbi:MAG: dTMP kinase [Candidatus Odinarchaeia archaeon]